MRLRSAARLRIWFESGCSLEDGLAELLSGVSDPLQKPVLAIVRLSSDEIIDVMLEVSHQTPDFPNWLADEASWELSELLLAGDEAGIDLSKKLR
jgi:hypothetical protein